VGGLAGADRLVVGMGNLWETPGVFPLSRSRGLTPTRTLVLVEMSTNKTRPVGVYRYILQKSGMVWRDTNGMSSLQQYLI